MKKLKTWINYGTATTTHHKFKHLWNSFCSKFANIYYVGINSIFARHLFIFLKKRFYCQIFFLLFLFTRRERATFDMIVNRAIRNVKRNGEAVLAIYTVILLLQHGHGHQEKS